MQIKICILALTCASLHAIHIRQIAAGLEHTLFLSDDAVYATGSNAYGQLGDMTLPQQQLSPLLVAGLPPVTNIATSFNYNLAVTTKGKLFVWGRLGIEAEQSVAPVEIQLPGSTDVTVVSVASGQNHAVVLLSDNLVYAWGSNANGQLGLGDDVAVASTLALQRVGIPLQRGQYIVQVAAGNGHTLFLSSDGRVYSCGWNFMGQLGYGFSSSFSVKEVPFFSSNPGRTVSAGDQFSLATTATATLVWGSNVGNRLGVGAELGDRLWTPTVLAPLLGGLTFAQIQVSSEHSVAKVTLAASVGLAGDSISAVATWGKNWDGRLGLGDDVPRMKPTLVAIPPIAPGIPVDVAQVQRGSRHSVVLMTDGRAFAFGDNSKGQLGLGDDLLRKAPFQITLVPPTTLRGVAAAVK